MAIFLGMIAFLIAHVQPVREMISKVIKRPQSVNPYGAWNSF